MENRGGKEERAERADERMFRSLEACNVVMHDGLDSAVGAWSEAWGT